MGQAGESEVRHSAAVVADNELRDARFAMAQLKARYYTHKSTGWAPCVHHGDSRDSVRAAFIPYDLAACGAEQAIPLLIRALADIGADVDIAVDQWWGVYAEGRIFEPDSGTTRQVSSEDRRFATSIQADELDLGLLETYNRWAARYEELWGERYVPLWEDLLGP